MIKKRPHTAREVAAFTLFSMEEEGAWSDGALHHYLDRVDLAPRDRALATRLAYGVIQNRLLCDWYLRQFSKVRLSKIAPRVHICLQLGIYQLALTDRIPAHAAVAETVTLIRNYAHANERTVGFANGVLRAVAQAAANNQLPRLNCPDKESFYSLHYSHPEWLVRLLTAQYGQKPTAAILAANNAAAPVSIRVNLLRSDRDTVLNRLTEDGFTVHPHPKAASMILAESGDIASHPLFTEGVVTIQDTASAVCVELLDPQPDTLVLDCCAAPGGKTFYIAERMHNQGTVISCDIYEHKLEKIQAGAQRLGLSIVQPTLQDAAQPRAEWVEKADSVLCDVPCSGMGIIRKKPEIRYKDADEIQNLPEIQKKILENCANYVKPGGTLVYSTCTILERENQAVVQKFLQQHPEFEAVPIEHPVFGTSENGMITLLPSIHDTDGFFIAKLRRLT